jgi:hypothetical protein
MPDSTIDRLFLMLEAQAKLASKERKELVEAFERQIQGLRTEVRTIAAILAIVALAWGGVGVALRVPGVEVVTQAAAPVVVAVAEPVAVEAAPAAVETPVEVLDGE